MKKKSAKNPRRDHYFQKAKNEKYPARSVYKLKEIQEKYGVIKKGDRVLDLGCYPGSWLLYAADQVKPEGSVVGVDVKPVEILLPANVNTVEGDILGEGNILSGIENRFDVVLSDMAPSTTGNKHVDSARSFALSEAALYIARQKLVRGGHFVCKIFQGEDFQLFMEAVLEVFSGRKIYKPKSTRKQSKEIYIIGLNKKTGGNVCPVTANGQP